ncbi:MAG: hypothetical protein ABI981_13375 [Betaproteobacteria bacterium]
MSYALSDEQLRAYAQVPLIDRLRWLDDLVRFTQLWRAAPNVPRILAHEGSAPTETSPHQPGDCISKG